MDCCHTFKSLNPRIWSEREIKNISGIKIGWTIGENKNVLLYKYNDNPYKDPAYVIYHLIHNYVDPNIEYDASYILGNMDIFDYAQFIIDNYNYISNVLEDNKEIFLTSLDEQISSYERYKEDLYIKKKKSTIIFKMIHKIWKNGHKNYHYSIYIKNDTDKNEYYLDKFCLNGNVYSKDIKQIINDNLHPEFEHIIFKYLIGNDYIDI